jgi:hypothetical protein
MRVVLTLPPQPRYQAPFRPFASWLLAKVCLPEAKGSCQGRPRGLSRRVKAVGFLDRPWQAHYCVLIWERSTQMNVKNKLR